LDKSRASQLDLDYDAYARADRHFEVVQRSLPPEAIQSVAREVVQRLAFRLPARRRMAHLPSDQQVDRLCMAVLSSEENAGDRIVFAARRDGANTETVYLDLISGAARRLGEMWTEDRVSFAQVTLACGRLYRIIRGLRHIIDDLMVDDAKQRHVLFILVPGETHTLGTEMAADIFRRQNWDVDVLLNGNFDEAVNIAEQNRYSAIVLVAHTEGRLPELVRLVLALRIAQPLANVVLAGNIIDQVQDVDQLAGADAVIRDIETAVATLTDIISNQTTG
jgi:methanogenic corrinoid protein MtbC1